MQKLRQKQKFTKAKNMANLGDQAFMRKTPKGSYAENTFAGALSFMRRQYSRNLKGIDIAVLGVPFDMAVSFRPGARFGPAGIRAASVQLAELKAYPYGIDPFNKLQVVDYGDVAFDYGYPESIVDETEKTVATILKSGAKTLCFGGDHFITYPILKAHSKHLGKPISLLHFDAHPDTWPDDGKRLDHGSMFTRAVKKKYLNPHKSVQIGIRTWVTDKQGFTHIDAPAVHATSPAEVAKQAREIVGDNPVYLTFDIDCLDPAFAPGTGTPVVGGLTTSQAISIIQGLGGLNFVGMDVVEVAPAYDDAEMTAIAGATLAYQWLCLMAKEKR